MTARSPAQHKEYSKLGIALGLATFVAYLHAEYVGLGLSQFIESLLGVLFFMFAAFKLYNLKEFAVALKDYKYIKNLSLPWGYVYPFIQIVFGKLYLSGYSSSWLSAVVIMWSMSGAYISWATIRERGNIKCLCLGGVIKLPLSASMLVEDVLIAVMALVLIAL